MATIVEHVTTGGRYFVIGTGYGAFKSSRPGLFLGNLSPSEQEGQFPMLAVCASDGEIRWGPTKGFKVLEVDGQSPSALASPGSSEPKQD